MACDNVNANLYSWQSDRSTYYDYKDITNIRKCNWDTIYETALV